VFEATSDAPASAVEAPRRSRKRTLTKVNRGSIIGKRIDELKALFTAALGDDALAPMRRMRIAEAAELKALAEKARGDYLRDGVGVLDDIVRIERKADQAVRGLRINESKPKPPSLAEYLASKRHAADDE
jgi:hypothetical protein